MKYHLSLFFFILIGVFSTGCNEEKKDPSYVSLKSKQNSIDYPILSKQDIQILHRISRKTLGKIQKGLLLEFSDVIALQRSGIEQDKIMHLLLFTRSKFHLTTQHILQLQNEGVPFKIINLMINS